MRLWLSTIFVCLLTISLAQEGNNLHYHALDYSIGAHLPVHSWYPKHKSMQSVSYSFGTIYTDTTSNWHQFYKNPHSGLQLNVSDIGNHDVYGYSFSLLPYMVINLGRYYLRSSHLKISLGASYFTRKYEYPENRRNWSIGSHVMLNFNTEYYYGFRISNNITLTTGIKFVHYSNAHTQLPNFGMNAFVGSAGMQFAPRSESINDRLTTMKSKKMRDFYITLAGGLGWHELGDAAAPKFGPKYLVYTYAVEGAKVYNKSFKLKVGLSYRFYESYRSFINENKLEPFYSNINQSSSNVFLSVGGELLWGHVGSELEVGLNVLKPFYDEFNKQFEGGKTYNGHFIKKYVPVRLGLKAYAINTKKAPVHNVFVGSHLNANWNTADFLGFSIGYVRKL